MRIYWPLIVTIVYVLCDTDALYEYLKVFGLDTKTMKEYWEFKRKGMATNLLEFISIKKNNFLTRLVTCPVCLSVFLSLMVLIVSFVIQIFSTEATNSPLITEFGVNVFGSWLGYKLLKFLDKGINA